MHARRVETEYNHPVRITISLRICTPYGVLNKVVMPWRLFEEAVELWEGGSVIMTITTAPSVTTG